MTSSLARVIYPELPDPLTPGDLQQLFSPSFDEQQWAPSVARLPVSQVALLVHLKIFQTIGRFLPATEVPLTAIEHVARRIDLATGAAKRCAITRFPGGFTGSFEDFPNHWAVSASH